MATPLITRPSGVNDTGLLETPWWAPSPPASRPDIDAFIARLVSRRAEAEYMAERLIEALDEADGNPDLEEDDPAGGDILDEPHDGGDDDEPSLGAPEIDATCRSLHFADGRWQHIVTDQTRWAKGASDDREEVDEDGTEIDRGEDGDDNGIADRGGACEQWGPNVGGDLYV